MTGLETTLWIIIIIMAFPFGYGLMQLLHDIGVIHRGRI